MSRQEMIRLMVFSGGRAAAKSVAIAALVLGPGFLMLFSGMQMPGMAWLFVGSFGLMAWTYRKPWRLGVIACLLPPAAAAFCYAVQLYIFGLVAPRQLILIAIGAGLLVGYLRARSHRVTHDDKGAPVAERTFGYLLIWIIAYGATQALGFISMNSFETRAGLVTGAFSTAMLAMVSIEIWRRFRKLGKASLSVAAVLSCLVSVGLVQPSPVQAQSQHCIDTRRSCSAPAGDTCGALDCLKKEYNACRDNIMPVAADAMYGNIQYLQRQIARENLNCAAPRPSATQQSNSAGQNASNPGASAGSSPDAAPITERTPVCMTASGRYIPMRGDPMALARKCVGGPTTCLDIKMSRHPESYNCPWVTTPQSAGVPGLSQPDTGSAGTGGGDSATLGLTPAAPTEPAQQQRIAAATAAVTAVLIAAGIAANIAQAIAAAIANALQAGVQMTAEDIQNAISQALFGDGIPASGSQSHAPPNTPQTDRFRPPTPILQPDGTPFETNDKGQYLAPDENGNWRWLDQQEAKEAARALREEARQRAHDQQRHQHQADDNMARSRQQRQDQYADERDAERDARAATEADRQRRDQLARGIWNTLASQPDNQRTRTLINMLGDARDSGDTQRLNALWNLVRGERQGQVDASAERAATYGRQSAGLAGLQAGAEILRDGSKAAIGTGLALASGGTLAAGQAVALGAAGTGGMVVIGATEGGMIEIDGQVEFDRWGAAKGAARGAKNAFNSLVGGVPTGGGKLRAIGKVLAPAITDGSEATANEYNRSGDWDKARGKGAETFFRRVGEGATDQAFDESARLTRQRAGADAIDMPHLNSEIAARQARDLATNAARKRGAGAIMDVGGAVVLDGKTLSQALLDQAKKEGANELGRQMGAGFRPSTDTPSTEARVRRGNVIDRLQAERLSQDVDASGFRRGAAGVAADSGSVEPTLPKRPAYTVEQSRRSAPDGRKPEEFEFDPDWTPRQREVAQRLQAERMGSRPVTQSTPDYEADMARREQAGSGYDGNRGDFEQQAGQTGDERGYTENGRRHTQMIADKYGIDIYSRSSTAAARQKLEEGSALAKRPEVKTKTGSALDVELGLKPKNQGLSSIFEPELPPKTAKNAGHYDLLKQRHGQRLAEYQRRKAEIEAHPDIKIDGQLVLDKKTGLPFTGDQDVFDARGKHGEPISPTVYGQAMRDLMRNPDAAVRHGAHARWNYSGYDNEQRGTDGQTAFEAARGIDQRIRDSHRTEALVIYRGGHGMGRPATGSATYSGPDAPDSSDKEDAS